MQPNFYRGSQKICTNTCGKLCDTKKGAALRRKTGNKHPGKNWTQTYGTKPDDAALCSRICIADPDDSCTSHLHAKHRSAGILMVLAGQSGRCTAKFAALIPRNEVVICTHSTSKLATLISINPDGHKRKFAFCYAHHKWNCVQKTTIFATQACRPWIVTTET